MLVNVFLVIVVVMCDAGLVHVTTNSAACNIIKSHQPPSCYNEFGVQ